MKKIVCLLLMCFCIVALTLPVLASPLKPKILFVPHDDRPVSFAQTADTVRNLDYDLVLPPQNILGNRTDLGHPDELWQWVFAQAKNADALVLSSDSLLYGSLVGSRKHSYTQADVLKRVEQFAQLKTQNPRLRIYVFGSIMRTPRDGAASGTEEPSYYAKYGASIFRLTELQDKGETEGLSGSEKKEQAKLETVIPTKAIGDWMKRRQTNFAASSRLIELSRAGTFNYLALGRDDNAPYSQTHKESRLLSKQGEDLGVTKFQALAGIDEIGMVLMTRAVNDLSSYIPFVTVRYADGIGAATVPSYSDEAISQSIRSHLLAAGAIQIPGLKRADLVLLVNTNKDGKTLEANWPQNTIVPRDNTLSFAKMVDLYVSQGYHVGVGDIAFSNGADNALMAELAKRNLLPKLTAYSGWNTATNSTGFVLGQGIMAPKMTLQAKNNLLAVRYLDDWAYQGNIRQSVAGELSKIHGTGSYGQLDQKKAAVIKATVEKMNIFVKQNLSDMEIDKILIDFPWNRMFETAVTIQSR